jgi:hypothetical protein
MRSGATGVVAVIRMVVIVSPQKWTVEFSIREHLVSDSREPGEQWRKYARDELLL